VAHLPYSIELHDSRVSAIALDHGVTTVNLRPAYIHRDGKGWSQDADIIVQASTLDATQADFPATLADGKMLTKLRPYHNLLELPLVADGPVEAELEFFSGNIAKIVGDSVKVILIGVPVFVENVS
jgi:hypothetical protein